MLPIDSIDGYKLDFPLGINDFEKVTRKPFNQEIWNALPQFLFMGEDDRNDSAKYNDAYSDAEKNTIFSVLGKNMQLSSVRVEFAYCLRLRGYMEITASNGEVFEFRKLLETDGDFLGRFFEDLSQTTRAKFGPHPLTSDYAKETLCKRVEKDKVSRFVISSNQKIVGYFIVDYNFYLNESERYASYGIDLDFNIDPVFAPCIADNYQGQGIASQAWKAVRETLKNQNIRSLVLMGGTQAPNIQARNFYKKFGFEECGEFFTENNGLNNLDMRVIL
jgi:RimJ/RimL family protein N-acetyltransferase